MKKMIYGVMLTGILTLTACGNSQEAAKPVEKPKVNETSKNKDELNQQVSKESKENDKPLSEQQNGEKYQEGFGTMKAVGVGYSDEAGIDGTDAPIKPIKMGSMNLSINKLGIVDVVLDDNVKTMFADKDKVRAIIVDMKAENTSKNDVAFNPNQSVIVTDTGEQLDSEMMFMGDAGGEFLGKVTKEGQSMWLVKNLNKDIKKLTLIVDAPYDTKSGESLGKEKRIEFNILSFEEAKKKDAKN